MSGFILDFVKLIVGEINLRTFFNFYLTISKKYGILTVGNPAKGVKEMVTKVSSKHQVTIPKSIAETFDLKKGDVLEVKRQGNKIIMIPKEVILEDKFPKEDLAASEKVLSKGLPKEEVTFRSGEEMVKFFKKRIKK